MRIFCWFYFDLKFVNAERIPARGAALLASNHISLLDGPLLITASGRLIHFPVTARFFSGRLIKWLFRKLHLFSVNPGNDGNIDMFKHCLKLLRNDQLLAIFLAGKLKRNGEEIPKNGLAVLADKTGAPVVPIRIVGSDKALSPESRGLRWRQKIRIYVGDPVYIQPEEGISEFSKRLMALINALG